jgi:hypothetical protein
MITDWEGGLLIKSGFDYPVYIYDVERADIGQPDLKRFGRPFQVISAASIQRTGQLRPSYLFTQGIERSMSETSFPPPKLMFSKGME